MNIRGYSGEFNSYIAKDFGKEYLVSRERHAEDTLIKVKNHVVGGNNFTIIAGPCSVENMEQINSLAIKVRNLGAHILRGGAYKPRTSPYDFQGLGRAGLEMIVDAGLKSDIPVVSEILDENDLSYFENVDVIQVGARNMQNFSLLKKLGRQEKPILLKRGQGCTIKEFLLSAEYILAEGNPNVILCERGIRSFEPYTRSTLDLSAIPIIRMITHLPIIVDPSHGTGRRELVEPMVLASVGAGAQGVMIEVHDNPARALCDGNQAQTPDEFEITTKKAMKLFETLHK